MCNFYIFCKGKLLGFYFLIARQEARERERERERERVNLPGSGWYKFPYLLIVYLTLGGNRSKILGKLQGVHHHAVNNCLLPLTPTSNICDCRPTHLHIFLPYIVYSTYQQPRTKYLEKVRRSWRKVFLDQLL